MRASPANVVKVARTWARGYLPLGRARDESPLGGTARHEDFGVEGLSVCCRNGLPIDKLCQNVVDGELKAPAPRQSRSGSALIFVRRNAAIESLALGSIGNSHSGILPQKRIKTSDLGARNH